MAEKQGVMFAEVRRQQIVRLVKEKGAVTVEELCEGFGVSPATIRSDLTALENQKLLQRTHGGAISGGGFSEYEQTSQEKEIQNIRQKQAIARMAKQYISPGSVIALDTGTTTYEFAKQLLDVRHVAVVTNDLKIASLLEQNNEMDLILLGGTVRHNFHCTMGENVLEMLKGLFIDTFFLATNGVSVGRGFSTPSMEIGRIKNAMIRCSARTVALADSSKINREAFYTFARLKEAQILVTDEGADRTFQSEALAAGTEVVCAAFGE